MSFLLLWFSQRGTYIVVGFLWGLSKSLYREQSFCCCYSILSTKPHPLLYIRIFGFLIRLLKVGQLAVAALGLLNRKSLSRVKHRLTCCLWDLVFFLAEGAWERPGLLALLACFSLGPWSRGKDPDAISPSGPAQGECVPFLTSWTLVLGIMGGVTCTQGPWG